MALPQSSTLKAIVTGKVHTVFGNFHIYMYTVLANSVQKINTLERKNLAV